MELHGLVTNYAIPPPVKICQSVNTPIFNKKE